MESVFVGIEIGGTKIQVVTGDGKASIVGRQRFTADPAVGAEGIRGQIAGALANIAGRQKIAAIGVGFGGPFNRETGRACCSHQVAGWDDFPLRDWLNEQLSQRGFESLPSAANFLFTYHPQHNGASLAQGLREQGIIVRHFGKPERIADYLRITVGTAEQNQALINVLDTLL